MQLTDNEGNSCFTDNEDTSSWTDNEGNTLSCGADGRTRKIEYVAFIASWAVAILYGAAELLRPMG
jgi:hypothetical protein